MKRKIIKIADKTFVVSLPTTWLQEHNLSKGDELELSYVEDNLSIAPSMQSPKIKQTTIDVLKLSERVLRWEISSLHKQGYDEIIVLNYSPAQLAIINDLVQNLFIGFIVKEKTNLKIVVGQIAITDAAEFNATLRRAFRQLISVSEEFLKSFETKDVLLLSNAINLEHENNKLTNFCERLLNKSLKEKEKGHFWYVVAWNLEKIVDNFKYIANHYKLKIPDVDEEVLTCIREVNKYIKLYYDCFYDFSFDKLTELSKNKKELEQLLLSNLENTQEFKVLLHYLHVIYLQVTDFSTSMIALKNKGI